MTSQAHEHFEAGNIQAAIEAQNVEVKAHPADVDRRGFLAELLCFAGNLDRADLMLDTVFKQAPAAAPNIALFRQVIRAEQARRQFFAEGRVPEFLAEPEAHIQNYLQATIALREGDLAGALAAATRAEEARPAIHGSHNGKPFDDLRDIDDMTAGIFEVLTSTGKYYWVPMERVELIDFREMERPRDLLWRRAHMVVAGGPDGEVFMPAIYCPVGTDGAELWDDKARLGRVTEWIGGDGTPVRGIGQRTLLVGDEAVPLLELGTLEFGHAT